MDGWVIVVANANGYVPTSDGNGKIGKKCEDYNGIDSGVDRQTCFDHWYTGCRENPLNGSSSKRKGKSSFGQIFEKKNSFYKPTSVLKEMN